MKKVFIGSDHAGFPLKEKIKKTLGTKVQFVDVGTSNEESVDYPIYAEKVAEAVMHDSEALGILTCGSGIGMSMAANKVPGVRAALAYSVNAAKLAREHNNANVLALPGREGAMDDPMDIVMAFLNTDFSGDARHARRVRQIEDIEKHYE